MYCAKRLLSSLSNQARVRGSSGSAAKTENLGIPAWIGPSAGGKFRKCHVWWLHPAFQSGLWVRMFPSSVLEPGPALAQPMVDFRGCFESFLGMQNFEKYIE